VSNGHRRALEELFRFPLMSAIAGRRTRRVARGTSIAAGPISHSSTNAPAPLTAVEEAILVVATGLTGAVMHDGPLQIPGDGAELGTPFMHVLGRSASSPDNAQATSFFVINDEGIWLIKRPADRDALADVPPRWQDWADADWIAAAARLKHRISDKRLEFPRTYPFYVGWNKQLSNRPGTTMFLPVVDCTRGIINILLNQLSEPDGQRPVIIDDWQEFRPDDPAELAAWIGAKLGLAGQDIPYEPIEGVKWIRRGFLNREISIPLGFGRTFQVDYEALFHLQNLMLMTQAMGLAGWVHAAVFPPYIFQRDAAKGWFGLGFHMHKPAKRWLRWPPLPAPLPNPVGIDGVLEGLCPPYVSSMNEAVDRVIEEKYGATGVYGDASLFRRPYGNVATAEAFLAQAVRYTPQAIEYTKDVCNYIVDKYGRFPAHVDAFHLPGVWLQVSHPELEYYEKYFDRGQFTQQAEHRALWDE
jgi:hypothetical protein